MQDTSTKQTLSSWENQKEREGDGGMDGWREESRKDRRRKEGKMEKEGRHSLRNSI